MAFSKADTITPPRPQTYNQPVFPVRTGEPSEITLFSEQDVFLFNEGTHFHLYQKFVAHLVNVAGVEGTYFAVWAPNAESVTVVGEFNGWNTTSHPLYPKGHCRIWESFFPS